VIDQVKWTNGVEEAIFEIMKGTNRSALAEFVEFSNAQLQNMIGLVRGELTKD
jgi:hypothetical protein